MPLRLFIAISVPAFPMLRTALGQLHRMARRVRSTPPETLHATLRFLGPVEPEHVAAITRVMEQVWAAEAGPTLQCRGVGRFAQRGRGAVVWAGLEGVTTLAETVTRLNRKLATVGFEAPARNWKPHVTLARLRGPAPEALPGFLERWSETEFGRFRVDAVRLVQSTLAPRGAVHQDVCQVALPAK